MRCSVNDRKYQLLIVLIRLCKRLCGPARSMASRSEPTQAYQISKASEDESECSKEGNAVHWESSADRENFRIKMSPEELTAMTRYQIGALKAFVCVVPLPSDIG